MSFRLYRRTFATVALVASLGLAACGDDSGDGGTGAGGTGGAAAAGTVSLKATTFEPAKLTVKAGDTVTWKWGGGVQHDVDGGDAFKSKLQDKGEFQHTFDQPGTFDYKCNVHPSTMTGTITVT